MDEQDKKVFCLRHRNRFSGHCAVIELDLEVCVVKERFWDSFPAVVFLLVAMFLLLYGSITGKSIIDNHPFGFYALFLTVFALWGIGDVRTLLDRKRWLFTNHKAFLKRERSFMGAIFVCIVGAFGFGQTPYVLSGGLFVFGLLALVHAHTLCGAISVHNCFDSLSEASVPVSVLGETDGDEAVANLKRSRERSALVVFSIFIALAFALYRLFRGPFAGLEYGKALFCLALLCVAFMVACCFFADAAVLNLALYVVKRDGELCDGLHRDDDVFDVYRVFAHQIKGVTIMLALFLYPALAYLLYLMVKY